MLAQPLQIVYQTCINTHQTFSASAHVNMPTDKTYCYFYPGQLMLNIFEYCARLLRPIYNTQMRVNRARSIVADTQLITL